MDIPIGERVWCLGLDGAVRAGEVVGLDRVRETFTVVWAGGAGGRPDGAFHVPAELLGRGVWGRGAVPRELLFPEDGPSTARAPS